MPADHLDLAGRTDRVDPRWRQGHLGRLGSGFEHP